MNTSKLKEVLAVQSCSHEDKLMREYLTNELSAIQGCEFYDDGDNIYAGKGSGQRPCVVAHMDTVHDLVTDLSIVELNGNLFGMNAKTMRQTGCGGDDKVGIFIALQMLMSFDNIKVVFFRDEEVGCHGSSVVNHEFFLDVTFVLQCDRRGNNDFVTNASGVELSGKAFQTDITPTLTQYGYKFCAGAMTDVMELKEQGINIAMANMSCGYYNPHSADEYVNIVDVANCLFMVRDLIALFGHIEYPHIAPKKSFSDNWWSKPLGNWDRSDSGKNWWDDDVDNATRTNSTSVLDLDLCADCFENKAQDNGLCSACNDWYNQNSAPLGGSPPFKPTIQQLPSSKKNMFKHDHVSKKPSYGPIYKHQWGKKKKNKR